MDIICDTHVWYNIASGAIDPKSVTGPSDRLLFTPVTVLELISKISPQSFPVRSAAARSLLTNAAGGTLDPERHLANIWGVSIGNLKIKWIDAIKALASARDLNELMTGVADYGDGVTRRVDQLLATTWRTGVYDDFENDMILSLDRYLPGYAAARKSGKMKQAGKSFLDGLRKAITTQEMYDFTSAMTFIRLQLHDQSLPFPSVIPKTDLEPYVRVYQEYFLDCYTKAPEANDWGDLEMFLYCQGNVRLLTAEKKWKAIAAAAGQRHWLI